MSEVRSKMQMGYISKAKSVMSSGTVPKMLNKVGCDMKLNMMTSAWTSQSTNGAIVMNTCSMLSIICRKWDVATIFTKVGCKG